MKLSDLSTGIATVVFGFSSATGASAAEKTTMAELSVPALLCLARLTAWVAPGGVANGPPSAPIKVAAAFMLDATVEVKDGETITAQFPAPYRPGSAPPINGGYKVTCDREGRVLNTEVWR